MPITAQERTDLITLVIGVFDAAPTSRVLSNLTKLVEAGYTVDQIATMLSENTNFESMYPSALLSSEFATKFAANLLGSEATTSTTARVEALVVSLLNAGSTRTEAVWQVTKMLRDTTDTEFAAAAAQLNNQVEVSLAFALDTSYTTVMTLEQLQSVISSVTSDTATVTAAKTAIAEGTAVSGVSTGETFTLTSGVDALTGTAKNDVFSATGTTYGNLDSINGGAGTDTLNIVDASDSMNNTGPSGVTLTSIETVNIQTSGDLGKVAVSGSSAVTAVKAVDTFTFPSMSYSTVTLGGTTSDGQTVVVDVDGTGTTYTAVTLTYTSATTSWSDGTNTYTSLAAAVVGAINSQTSSTTNAFVSGGVVYSKTSLSNATITGTAISDSTTASIGTDADGLVEGAVFTITYGGVTLSTAALDSTPTKAEAQALIAGVINGIAGSTVATVAGDNLVITAPVAGVDLPTISIQYKADGSGDTKNPTGFTSAIQPTSSVSNVAASAAVTAVSAETYDFSAQSSVTTLNVTTADSVNLKAATTTGVNVSGVTGNIKLDGGKDVTVTDATANKSIDLDNAAGAVTVTDSSQGTGAITVDDATNVTITASGVTTGVVTVGATDEATGTVAITSNGSAYSASGSNVTLGAITVTGGTSVTVNQTASSDTSKAAADTSIYTVTNSAVTVTADDNTTSVTVNQSAAVSGNDAVTAVAAKASTYKVTFTAAAANDVITLTLDTGDTIVFTASKALTAAEVAAAFANLVKNAVQGSSAVTNGVYTNTGTIDQGWTSGSVTTNTDSSEAYVTFSNESATATITSFANAGTGTVTLGSVTAGTAAVAAETGRMGVSNNTVDVKGTTSSKDAVTTVTLSGYGSSSKVDSDALTTLNLSSSSQDLTVTTASTGTITANLDGVAGSSATLDLDGTAATVTGLTINTSGTKSDVEVTADAVTALTINAAADLDLTNSSFDKATSITVTGAGNVILDGDASTSVLKTVNASAATGNVDASAVALTADGTYTGGTGADTFTVTASATKASTGGAGDDVITVSSFGTGGSVDAGEGTDTLVMALSDAVTASASATSGSNFMAAATNFEKLSLKQGSSSSTVNLANLTYSSIVSAGMSSGTLTLSNAASGVTLEITGAGTFNVGVKDAATGTADVVNLVTNVDGNLAVGTVTVANVETINVTADDKFVDTTGAVDEFGASIADGKDDTNSVQTMTLAADKATTVNVSGSADLTLTLSSSTAVTTVNASTMTGNLTLTANGATAGTTVTGGTGNDVLTASGSNDKLIGGAGNDKLYADTLTTLTGGEGNDTFVMKDAVDSTLYSTITDLSSGDVINFNNGVSTFTATAIKLAANATFAQYLDAAVAANSVSSNSTEAAVWFQFNGDTFVVVDGYGSSDATGYTAAEDSVIAITGLVDLSTAVFNSTADTLTIA